MGFSDINLQVSGPQQPASTYKTKVLKGQVSFAAQVTEPNTKYVIKHNFDLNGGSVAIPEGCLLEFDGGAISNGTLVGQNTCINANVVRIFNSDTTLDGTWKNKTVFCEWFGGKADGITDTTPSIQKAIDFASISSGVLKFMQGTYIIMDSTQYHGLIPRKNTKFIGTGATTLKMGSKRCNIFSNESWYFEDGGWQQGMSDIVNISFENIILDGNADVLGDPYEDGESIAGDNYSYGIYMMKAENITIKNCIFKNFVYGGHNLWGCRKQKIIDNHYTSIGVYDAHFGNYSAMGSDGNVSYPSVDVYYGNNTVETCGGALRCNAGGNYGTTELNYNFIVEYCTFKNLASGLGMFWGNYANINIRNNYFLNINEALLVDPMPSVQDSYYMIEGVTIENNIFETDDTFEESNTRAFAYLSAVPSLIFRNNIINYKRWSYIPFISFRIAESLDDYYSTFKKNIIFEGNTIKLDGCSSFMLIPSDRNLIFKNNILSISYFTGKIFDMPENNNCNLFISNNDFSGTDNTKLFAYEPKHVEADGNIGFETKVIRRVEVAHRGYEDIPIKAEEVFIRPEGDYNATFYFSSEARNQLVFLIYDSTGTPYVSGPIPISIIVYGKYYNYTRN